jgi:CHAT domain-containing protein
VLDPETALVEYTLGEQRSWVWVVTATDVVTAELPARAEIEARVGRVRDLIVSRSVEKNEVESERAARVRRADADYKAAARDLSAMVLGPVAKAIAGKRLAIVADGALQLVPFDALPKPDGRGWMIEEYEVAMMPSATALETLRRQTAGRATALGSVAVVADPVFEPGDPRVAGRGPAPAARAVPKVSRRVSDVKRSIGRGERDGFARLAGSRAEAEAIGRLMPGGQSLVALDFAANLDLATGGALSKYRIVHFATHGYVPSQAPELSGLVLSLVDEAGSERPGYLGLSEIYGLRLPAELVVLSACETGLGRQVRGEGIVGLTRGFMYAGARRVVASLWKVDDRPTSELMTRYYARMLVGGKAPSRALREAKLELLRATNWKAPYYWAAFQLYGEWR